MKAPNEHLPLPRYFLFKGNLLILISKVVMRKICVGENHNIFIDTFYTRRMILKNWPSDNISEISKGTFSFLLNNIRQNIILNNTRDSYENTNVN